MVFESIIVDLINTFLGDYVENLDASQLKLSLWGGDVTLQNLDIKANAFDSLDLPIKILQGHLGKLTLKIPWKHLYTEPWIAELDGLYVLAIPNLAMAYDADKERKYSMDAKRKALQKIEEAKARELELKQNAAGKSAAESGDTFGLKLGMQVLKNLQVKINNIHIRYEDTISSSKHPYALGVTLSNLSLQTTDPNWNACVIKDNVRSFHKLVQMDCLAVYWNSSPKMYSTFERGPLKNIMKSSISSPDNLRIVSYDYLVNPISSVGKLIINLKPEQVNFASPMFWLDLRITEFRFGLERSQFNDLTAALEAIDRQVAASKYRKYRPVTGFIKGVRGLRWKYAYDVVLNDFVRYHREQWTWAHMAKHIKMCRKYTELFKKKLKSAKSLSSDENKEVERFEETLDIFNITMCRQRAEMQARREDSKKPAAATSGGGGGWFSGWWGGNKASHEATAAQDTAAGKLSNLSFMMDKEMTPEEKQKLYEALDYQEGENAMEKSYPKDYVNVDLNVQLQTLGLALLEKDGDAK